MTDAINLRLGGEPDAVAPRPQRAVARAPRSSTSAACRCAGNPDLERAAIDNYDVRVEAFPTLSEVLAAGFFYKNLHEPIEQVIQGGSPPLLVPRNSDERPQRRASSSRRAPGWGGVWSG